MARVNVSEVKKPSKQIHGFHLRNYGWSSKKTISQRRVALMMALYDTEEPKKMRDRMLYISQWNKKMCYDTYMFWDELSYGDMWYLEHACELVEAMKEGGGTHGLSGGAHGLSAPTRRKLGGS